MSNSFSRIVWVSIVLADDEMTSRRMFRNMIVCPLHMTLRDTFQPSIMGDPQYSQSSVEQYYKVLQNEMNVNNFFYRRAFSNYVLRMVCWEFQTWLAYSSILSIYTS